MTLVTAFLVLASLPVFVFLLCTVIPVKQKPRWIDFLPAVSAGVLLMEILVSGFQVVLIGLYLFCLVLFLTTVGRLFRPAQAHPLRRGWALVGSLLALVLLLLCLIPPVLLPAGYQSAAPTGPFTVGTVTYGWEDNARPETYTPDPADFRKIAVQFWYPVDGGQDHLKDGSAVDHAPLSAAQNQYPLVVFSHGAFGVRGSNTTTYMELASQGYIVASIDHAYHAFYTKFPDGQSALISQQFLSEVQRNQSGQLSEAENFTISFAWMDLRTADIRFTLDQIEELNSGAVQNPLAGHIDLEKIGLFGHSLGGAASAAVCREDARCKAAAVIDSTMFGEYQRGARDGTLVTDPFPRPLMIFYNGDTYHATAEHLGYGPDINAFEHAAAPAYSVVVTGAQHLNFTDLPARAPVLARLLGSMMTVNGGTTGAIRQERCTEILDRYLVDFFNQALLEKPSQLLAGQDLFEEVEFTARLGQ